MAKRSCGIVGLPNVGKSTLFKVLSGSKEELAANYPFCTIEPNVGIAFYEDERLETLAEMFKSRKTVKQSVSFIDIAGLVEGASNGEGLGNKFLSNIREVSAIMHVIRCFEDTSVTHVYGDINPIRDAQVIETELLLADIQNIENILFKLRKRARTEKDLELDVINLSNMKKDLELGKVRKFEELDAKEQTTVKKYQFLTTKPMLYLLNVAEDKISDESYKSSLVEKMKEGLGPNVKVEFISSKLEEELSNMDEEDKAMFMEEYGIKGNCISKVISAGMKATGTHTFYTVGEKEAHAWDIAIGGTSVDAARAIHNDLADKFVRAEVVSYNDMLRVKSNAAARESGVLRTEGSTYIVQDGDIINILASS